MVMDADQIIRSIILTFHYFFLVFTILIVGSYIILAIFSTKETISYLKKNSFVHHKDLIKSPLAPSISIIAPAYNESLNIVENGVYVNLAVPPGTPQSSSLLRISLSAAHTKENIDTILKAFGDMKNAQGEMMANMAAKLAAAE